MTAPTTPVRWRVLVLGCALSMITYLDRACFGAATSELAYELGLRSVADLGITFTAFALGYGLFEVPSGWWGEVGGTKRVLLRIVTWWSLFTALTGLVGWKWGSVTLGGLSTLIVVRFLFGAGEAGAYPNLAQAIRNWFPPHERGAAQGWIWMSGRLAGGLTPLIWMLLVHGTSHSPALITWRQAFWLFGVIGLGWCAVFAWQFYDHPDLDPRVSPEERRDISAGTSHAATQNHSHIPWTKILFSRNLAFLYLMYFCATYGWIFNITYLPSCLETQFGVDKQSVTGALYKGGPLWLGALGCLAGGYLTDRLIQRGKSKRWSRRLPGLIGHTLCALCYLAAAFVQTPFQFFLAISLAALFNDLMMGSAWATCQDVSGRHTAIVAGCMNTASSLGAAAAGWLTSVILNHALTTYARTHSLAVDSLTLSQKSAALAPGYYLNLLVYSSVYLLATLCWLGLDPEETID